jgi:hypothetical protein
LHTVSPMTFHTANKQSFSTDKAGTLMIPNNVALSFIYLHDVLYSVEVAYTLVSVGWLSDLGFDVCFTSSTCTMSALDGSILGHIHKDAGGLYHIMDWQEMACVLETLTLDQLYQCIGHIAPKTTR